eukprot:CAMPEP_0173469308 /NCGR_PEP_ID=MMETSP1357-20121228/77295_1 /TAXON_ID=77926 /ORGANISM="Hemiselmis rufescens, Strain PCC563" /LENGTH=234 /DNA_ID=CAMNT_0014437545 /DNA_START=4448 /DNA_END=5147 /DNA_ORIENTATION=-
MGCFEPLPWDEVWVGERALMHPESLATEALCEWGEEAPGQQTDTPTATVHNIVSTSLVYGAPDAHQPSAALVVSAKLELQQAAVCSHHHPDGFAQVHGAPLHVGQARRDGRQELVRVPARVALHVKAHQQHAGQRQLSHHELRGGKHSGAQQDPAAGKRAPRHPGALRRKLRRVLVPEKHVPLCHLPRTERACCPALLLLWKGRSHRRKDRPRHPQGVGHAVGDGQAVCQVTRS